MEYGKQIEEIDGIPIKLCSVAGINTTILLPSINVIFDMGTILPKSINIGNVFITHGHTDHISAFAQHVFQRSLVIKTPMPKYWVPKSIVNDMNNLLNCFRTLNQSDTGCEINGMSEGDQVKLRNGYTCTSYTTKHRVDSQGYIIWYSKSELMLKLKEQLKNGEITNKDIIEKKKSGIEINTTSTVPIITYTGDTIIDGISEEAKNVNTIIMEMTYVDSRMSVEEATNRGHVHLFDFCKRIDEFKNKNIVFIHFSGRYSKEHIFMKMFKYLPQFIWSKIYLGIDKELLKFDDIINVPCIYFKSKEALFGFLSNFYHTLIVDEEGTEWKSVEHLYQASKYEDAERKLLIREQKKSFNASLEANKMHNHIRANWTDDHKIKVMEKCLNLKFNQHEDLKNMLLRTSNIPLVKKTDVDMFWGCGADETGKNMLGQLLMKLRNELRKKN
jgi:ribonuclease Z